MAAPTTTIQDATNIGPHRSRLNALVANDGGAACEGRFRYREAGSEEWVYPTSHDGDTDWTNPERAYDGSGTTSADGSADLIPDWTPWLELYIAETVATKARALTYPDSWGHYTDVQVDVRRASDSEWQNIFNDTWVPNEWQEYEIGSSLAITGVRLRYYNSSDDTWYAVRLRLVQIYAEAWAYTDWANGLTTDNPFSADITGLTLNTEYEFQAQNRNEDEGDWSSSKFFTTGFTSPLPCFRRP